MGGVMNEGHLEVRVMGQQASVENVVSLVVSEILKEKEVEADEDVRETFKGNVDQIDMDLERTILMIDEKNIVPTTPLSE
jgi:hypothetical protein